MASCRRVDSAVVAGDTGRSELVRRILSTDPKVMMPAPDSHLALTDIERAILVRWIEQGAEWKPHWAFIPPTQAGRAEDPTDGWARNEIDRFVLATLESHGLTPVTRSAARDAACGASRWTSPVCRRRWRTSTRLWPISRQTRTNASSIGCWPRPRTASEWRWSGSTSRATPTRTATKTTGCGRCGRGGTG